MLITPFDPWKSSMCTCPKKYSFSPYTGCSHACLYCYITSYIPNAFHARLKKDLFRRLKKEVGKVDTYISMSNSSDPYTPEEEELGATRKCLKIFKEKDVPLLIITKSNMVARDIDILSDMRASVSITITTLRDEIAKKMEPYAPPPSKRLEALKNLSKDGIPCSVRLDPIIPGINEGEVEKIVEAVAPYVHHIVSSTIKPRNDSMKRMGALIDMDAYEWERHGNTFYLPREMRFEMLKRVEEACRQHEISFAACREGYKFRAKSCDGSHLIPSYK